MQLFFKCRVFLKNDIDCFVFRKKEKCIFKNNVDSSIECISSRANILTSYFYQLNVIQVTWFSKSRGFFEFELLYPLTLVRPIAARCLNLLWFLHPKQILFFVMICFEITFTSIWKRLLVSKMTKKRIEQLAMIYFWKSIYLQFLWNLIVQYTNM